VVIYIVSVKGFAKEIFQKTKPSRKAKVNSKIEHGK
jgi:hypothetical protein